MKQVIDLLKELTALQGYSMPPPSEEAGPLGPPDVAAALTATETENAKVSETLKALAEALYREQPPRYGLTGDAAKRFNEIVSEVCYLTGASKSLPGGASTK